jgi:hypothetical protein
MSDLLSIHIGERPWMPSPDAEEVETLDFYNIPLAGLLTQHGATYLFVCAAGEEETANVWLYAHLNEQEASDLLGAREKELVREMARCLTQRHVVAALAANHRIVSSASFETHDEAPGRMVRRFLSLERARLREREVQLTALDRDPSLDPDDAQLSLV